MYSAYTFVSTGTINGLSGFASTNTLTNPGPIVVGTTFYLFTLFSAAGDYTPGNALALDGTQFNVLYDSSGANTIGINGNNQLYIPASAVLTTPNIGAATGSSLSTVGDITGNLLTGNNISSVGNVNVGSSVNSANLSLSGNVLGNLNVTNYVNANNVTATTSLSLSLIHI